MLAEQTKTGKTLVILWTEAKASEKKSEQTRNKTNQSVTLSNKEKKDAA